MADTKVILTTYGNDEILKAMAAETNVYISAMVYGDGGGASVVPSTSQTQLVNQTGIIYNVTKRFDESDGFIYFSGTIPANAPATTIRELGLIDVKGGLIAVAGIPDTSKPAEEDGLEVSLPISLGFKTSTGEVMLVYVDQGEGFPDKIWVVEQINNIKIISGNDWI